MVNRTVATKLSEEEHALLLDACNKSGCTPSVFIKKLILGNMQPDKTDELPEMTIDDLRMALGLTKKDKIN